MTTQLWTDVLGLPESFWDVLPPEVAAMEPQFEITKARFETYAAPFRGSGVGIVSRLVWQKVVDILQRYGADISFVRQTLQTNSAYEMINLYYPFLYYQCAQDGIRIYTVRSVDDVQAMGFKAQPSRREGYGAIAILPKIDMLDAFADELFMSCARAASVLLDVLQSGAESEFSLMAYATEPPMWINPKLAGEYFAYYDAMHGYPRALPAADGSGKPVPNVYALLDVPINASTADIQRAMVQASKQQTLTAAQLAKCREWLLNPQTRAKYDARLLQAYPHLAQVPPRKKVVKIKPPPRPENTPDLSAGALIEDKRVVGMAAIVFAVVAGLALLLAIGLPAIRDYNARAAEAKAYRADRARHGPMLDKIEREQEYTRLPTAEGASGIYYVLMHRQNLGGGRWQVIIKQTTLTEGDMYARRLIDCNTRLQKILGEGETLARALDDRPDAQMSSYFKGSNVAVAMDYLCR